MVSDSELVARLRELLRESDLTTTTTAAVRRRLEEDFAVDLSSKKAFIREQVDLFLSTELAGDGEGAGDDTPKDEQEEAEAAEEEGEGGSRSEEEEEEEEEKVEEEDEEVVEDDEDDDEGDSSGKGSKKRRLDKANKDGKRRGGGFTKLCSLSPELQKFVGASELARTEVVKKLWEYIRANNLQDPNNKRKIICDEKFKNLFNVNTIDMFQMNKALTKHIWPLNSEDGPVSPERSKPKEKPQKKDKNEGKRLKGGSSGPSGLLAPLQLSDDLVKFIGTGENMLSRSDVVKRMWEYIKQNNLQDPQDRRQIICDEKLKDLFKVESFNGFTVSKLLAPHFVKTK